MKKVFINLLVITLIFIRVPKDKDGLTYITTKSNQQENLDILIAIFTLINIISIYYPF